MPRNNLQTPRIHVLSARGGLSVAAEYIRAKTSHYAQGTKPASAWGLGVARCCSSISADLEIGEQAYLGLSLLGIARCAALDD